MNNKRIGRLSGTAAAVVGGLAMANRVGAVPAVITGNGNFFEVSANSASTYHSTQPGTAPSYPYIQLREYFAPGGGFDERVWIKVNLSSIPAGSAVTNAKLGLAWFSSSYGTYTPHSDNVDLWSVADEFTGAANFLTYDGSNAWTHGPQAGIDGYARTGPTGRHLGSLYKLGTEPAGSPSDIVMNSSYPETPPPNYSSSQGATQEYKSIYDHDRGNIEKFAMDALDEYLTKQKLAGKDAYLALTIDNDSAAYMQFIATSDDGTFWATDTGNPFFANQPKLDLEYAAFVPTWHLNDNGDWSGPAGNWYADVVPNGVDQSVVFGSYVTGSVVVNVDAPKAVGHVTFDSPETYTIGGTNPLTMDVSSGSATIDVLNGSQVISAPLVLNNDTTIGVAASAPLLTVTGDLSAAAGVTLTKTGGGILAVNRVRVDGLAVDEGIVQTTADGTEAGMSIVKSLTVAAGARLDLADNDFIVDYASGETSPEFALRDLVKAVAEGGTSGIGFDPGDGNRVIAVAEGTESGLADLNGIAFPDDTVVIGKYTYYGDANLDGQVTSDDYVAVDVGIGVGDSWVEGDFDFSGSVTSDDYVAIDVNLGQGSGNPLAFAELKAEMVALHTAMFGDSYVQKLAIAEADGFAALVPEPGALSIFVIAAASTFRRRRRGARID